MFHLKILKDVVSRRWVEFGCSLRVDKDDGCSEQSGALLKEKAKAGRWRGCIGRSVVWLPHSSTCPSFLTLYSSACRCGHVWCLMQLYTSFFSLVIRQISYNRPSFAVVAHEVYERVVWPKTSPLPGKLDRRVLFQCQGRRGRPLSVSFHCVFCLAVTFGCFPFLFKGVCACFDRMPFTQLVFFPGFLIPLQWIAPSWVYLHTKKSGLKVSK